MKIALIAPSGLSQYTELGDMHFIVPGYSSKKFYATETKFKMLDNGAWEYGEAINTDILLDWAKTCRVQEIVLPDVLMNKQQTLLRSADFISTLTDKQKRYYSWAYVPQGKNLEEWIEAYKLATKTEWKIDTLCLPKWLESKYHARAKVISYLKGRELWDYRPHHLFGLDSLSEFFTIDPKGIRSVDSAKPITYAYHKVTLPLWESPHLVRPSGGSKPRKIMDQYVAQNTSLFRFYANWRENARRLVDHSI